MGICGLFLIVLELVLPSFEFPLRLTILLHPLSFLSNQNLFPDVRSERAYNADNEIASEQKRSQCNYSFAYYLTVRLILNKLM